MAILLVVAILLDRLLKAVIHDRPDFYQPLIGEYLTLEHSLNINGPLGINVPSGLLFGVAIVVLVGLTFLFFWETRYRERILLLTVFAGVASNTIDRFIEGHVIDVFRIAPGLIFNIADLMIVGGVLVLLFLQLHGSRR